jgi:hypothetical protein
MAITFGNTFWEYCNEKNSITVNCEGHVEYLKGKYVKGWKLFLNKILKIFLRKFLKKFERNIFKKLNLISPTLEI